MLVALWSVIIFLTIPFARAVQKRVAGSSYGSTAFRDAVIVLLLLALVVAVLAIRRAGAGPWTRYLWLAIVIGIFVDYTVELKSSPEEAVHFIEYGVLGLLIYRALTHSITDPTIYLTAAAIGASVGILDEVIQWITPDRYWDLRDIWLNFFGVALTQIGIALGLQPSLIRRPVGEQSVRWLCRALTVALLLLASNLVNTPARIRWYAERVPAIAFLDAQNDQMVEYGYLYVDPAIGRFRSRFSSEELPLVDEARAIDAAQIIDRYPAGEHYRDFLAAYPASVDPFVHELRVHQFRRDHYEPTDAAIAYRENQILEKYYGKTLARSTVKWPPEKTSAVLARATLDGAYESPVSEQLFTRFEERQIVTMLALALIAVQLGAVFARRSSRRRAASATGSAR